MKPEQMILWETVERLSDEVKTEFEQLHKDFENVTKRDTKTIGERLKIVASKIAFFDLCKDEGLFTAGNESDRKNKILKTGLIERAKKDHKGNINKL